MPIKSNILVPAWYSVDGNGLVWGGPNASVLKTAAERHVPVMPIVATAVHADLHKLFTTAAAKNAFVIALLGECKKYSYSGFQIDFENVNWTDRDLLSSLVADTAAALHREACSEPSRLCLTLPVFRARAVILTGFMPIGAAATISGRWLNPPT
jgi:spore germination protein YaaH